MFFDQYEHVMMNRFIHHSLFIQFEVDTDSMNETACRASISDDFL
jgi:hypothetical protein